jgi:hypothetical protein
MQKASTRLLVLGTAALVAFFAPSPVAANHPQVSGNFAITFDHDGDNEWWVEVLTKTAGGDSIVLLEVRPESSATFRGLEEKGMVNGWMKWGPAQAFRIPPGDRVMFRAHMVDGTTGAGGFVDSCFFTHPAGVEQCSTLPPPPPPGTFDATFTGVRGNEWWVQANVATNGPPVVKVDVTTDAGATWRPLAKQSWGPTAWAASYRIVQGTVLQLRATASDGQTDLSSCRQWIPPPNTDAAIVACGSSPPPPPPDGLDAVWSNVKGNNYWVEATVKSNGPIYGMFLVMDCDPNRDPGDMTYRAEWNKWTLGNRYIPSGTHVTMVAFGEKGTSESGGYIWPQGTPTSGCPPPPDWYKQGSYAEYALYSQTCGSGGCDDIRATLRMTLQVPPEPYAPYWDAVCSGTITHTAPDGTTTTQAFSAQSPTAPPDMTRRPRVGYQVDWSTYLSLPSTMVTASQACMSDDSADWRVTATGEVTKPMRLLGADGQPRTMTVWHAQNDGNADGEDRTIEWETKVGLVLHWENKGRTGGMPHFGGDLIRTNAPV